MTAQTYQEPTCAQTGKPYYPMESQTDEHLVAVQCSECGEILTEYLV